MSDAKEPQEEEEGELAPPAIPFETWAEVAAELLQRTSTERLEILGRRSIKPEDWTPSDAFWSAAVAEDVMAGDFTRADVYARRCADIMKARREAMQPKVIDGPAQPSLAGQPPTPAGQPAGAAWPDRPLSATMVAVNAPPSALLPFAPSVPADVALENARKHAMAVQVTALPRPDTPLAQTMELSDLHEILRSILPFGGSSPATTLERKPAKAEAPAVEPELTLERFASLCAELELDTDRAMEILSRYHLRADQKARLDAVWGAKFRAEPAVYTAFQDAKTVYTKWLLSVRRGPT